MFDNESVRHQPAAIQPKVREVYAIRIHEPTGTGKSGCSARDYDDGFRSPFSPAAAAAGQDYRGAGWKLERIHQHRVRRRFVRTDRLAR